jgi:predicted heme/steroid binding protein
MSPLASRKGWFPMRTFTIKELAGYDGSHGVAYVAFEGRVYDVSPSFLWQRGKHQVTHRAGTDLTEALKSAPHGAELLERFPVVGRLAESD